MPDITFKVNGYRVTIDAEDDDALLYVLRDRLGITGPKYGCGVGVCGACTSHMKSPGTGDSGEAIRPCVTPMSAVASSGANREVTTIEGVAGENADGSLELHPVQQAWLDEDVAQCGFCQAGQIMTAITLLEANPQPTDADIDEAMKDNVCRCGTYSRIRRAIKRASGQEVGPAQGPSTGVVEGGDDPLNVSGLPGVVADTADQLDELLGVLLS